MSEDDGGQPVVVDVGECRCPGTPHASDSVTLYPEPTLPLGLAARAALSAYGTEAMALEVALGQAYLQHGIESWSFVEDDEAALTPAERLGNGHHYVPVPVNWPNILRLLPFARGGKLVADAADGLYSRAVFGPLLTGSPTPSRNGSAGDTTSHPTKRQKKRPTSSKSSSPEPTAVTK